jgi:hypothetical protein
MIGLAMQDRGFVIRSYQALHQRLADKKSAANDQDPHRRLIVSVYGRTNRPPVTTPLGIS